MRVFIFIVVFFVASQTQAATVTVPVSLFERIQSLQSITGIDQLLSPVVYDSSPVFSQGNCPASSDAGNVLSDSYFLQTIHRTSGLPQSYIPPNLVDVQPVLKQIDKKERICVTESTAVHLKNMIDDMAKQKLDLYIVSGYRSYEAQDALLKEKGKEYNKKGSADRAAAPGFSEHQLGTSVDVASLTKSGIAFAKTPESAWLREHAHKYGFIISYGDQSEYKTGYISEPWHLRYVGVENALLLKAGNYTLAYIAGFYRPIYVHKMLDIVRKNIVPQK